jgi:ATP adenylyltransferase
LTFEELKDFLTNQMRMSHIYQPLLIKNLLESSGLATVRQLAVNFAAQDESQVHKFFIYMLGYISVIDLDI